MPINIFANAESTEAPPSSDIVGRFRAGRQLQGRPMSLQTWRITTGDPAVASEVAELLGAVEGPQEWDTKTDERLEVITEASSVDVIFDNAKAIRSEMVLWGRKGKLRSCDGITQAAKDGQPSKPCECPSSVSDKMQAAKDGTGCEPSISYLFRLADAPELGRFRFQTGSWTVARLAGEQESKLEDIDGPATATLELQQRTRKDTGTTYTVAILSNIRPAEVTA